MPRAAGGSSTTLFSRFHLCTVFYRQKQNSKRTHLVRPTSLTVSCSAKLTAANGSSATYLLTPRRSRLLSDRSVRSHCCTFSHRKKSQFPISKLIGPKPLILSRSTVSKAFYGSPAIHLMTRQTEQLRSEKSLRLHHITFYHHKETQPLTL